MKNPMKQNLLILFGWMVVCIVFLAACEESGGADVALTDQEEVNIFEDANLTNSLAEEDLEITNMAADTKESTNGRSGGDHLQCAEITRDEDQKLVTIDFGDGCVGPYGRERSGKILIQYGGEFNDNMANRIISFENYVVNNKGISGTIELRDFNRNDSGNLTATRKMNEYTVTFPDGNSFTINGSTTRAWLEGEGDGDPTTNVIQTTGSYEGVSTRGRSFTHVITEPIIANFACKAEGGFLRVSGVKEMTKAAGNNSRTRTINYGDGTCDNEIVVTINDRTFTITE